MLNVYYADMKGAVYNTVSYFKYDYGKRNDSGRRSINCVR